MKLLNSATLLPLLLALPAAAESPVSTAITFDPGNLTNQVLLTW